MQKEYHLSSGAILYALLRLHKPGIYGVDNVLEGMTDETFPAFIQRSEMELMEKGCGTLNFDGVFELEEDFAALLGRSADAKTILTAAKRKDQQKSRQVIYLVEGAAASLTCPEGREPVLTAVEDPAKAVTDFLDLPESAGELQETVVDSTLAAEKDEAGLLKAGCTADMARLVVNAAEGMGGYAVLGCTREGGQTGELVLLYGPEGIVSLTAEYTQAEELFRLTPLTAEEVRNAASALTEQ